MDAFDADVLILSTRDDERGNAAREVIVGSTERLGSVILLPELLSKPLRTDRGREYAMLIDLLATLELKPVDLEIAEAASTLGAKYGLRAADAIHLATAVVWGADCFHTNNRRDFGTHITEVEVRHLD